MHPVGTTPPLEPARPPDPLAELPDEGRDRHRANEERVEEDAERDRDTELRQGNEP
jgi:hypothetical protein